MTLFWEALPNMYDHDRSTSKGVSPAGGCMSSSTLVLTLTMSKVSDRRCWAVRLHTNYWM
ncbi:MAG: hypothetical protein ACREXS_02330 [Gammaproteobacteria bacterium]